MRNKLTPERFYNVTDRKEFRSRLLDDINVEHEVIGIEIASIGDDTCSVRFVPRKNIPREYSVSSQILQDLYEDSVIELKERSV